MSECFLNRIIKKGTYQTKTVSPTTSQQNITPDANYDALSQVTINAVTSSIDSDIIPHKIKTGTNILSVVGDLNTAEQLAEGNTALDILLDSSVTSLRNHAFTDMNVQYLTLEYNGVITRIYNSVGSPTDSHIYNRTIKIFVPVGKLLDYKLSTYWTAFGTSLFGFDDLIAGDTFDTDYTWYSNKSMTTGASGTVSTTGRYYCSSSNSVISRNIYNGDIDLQYSDTSYPASGVNSSFKHYFPLYTSGGDIYYSITMYYSTGTSSEYSTTISVNIEIGTSLKLEHPDSSSAYIYVKFNQNYINIYGNPLYGTFSSHYAVTGIKINSLSQTW